MKKSLNEIDTTTDEGKLLIAALAHITCTICAAKEPDEILAELAIYAEEIFKRSKGE